VKGYSPILQDLIEAFKQLPGIGIKSAQRIVFYLLKENDNKGQFLADSIQKSFQSIKECDQCRMYTEEQTCGICTDVNRDSEIICIVETPADLIAIENTSQFKGKYFTGDGCKRDKDGYYWITGRVDDCINVSGHLLGTAEIESAFVEHELVSEAAVVGYPHDIKGQGIYAYVTDFNTRISSNVGVYSLSFDIMRISNHCCLRY
jgi:recombinational DNA repair protein RecR